MPEQPAGGPYEYDWVGNRLNPPADPNPMVYNAADQLMSWPGMHTYTYYPDGSLQYEKNAAGNQVIKSYAYTPDGLLSTAEFNGKTLTNLWDADANRVSMSVTDGDYQLVYNLAARNPAVLQESKPSEVVQYIRKPNGALLARIQDESIRYYHFDELGSTKLLTDGDGDMTDEYAYDAYGSLLSHNRRAGSVDQPYQYVGELGYYTHWPEPGFTLLNLGVRFYDRNLAVFTQIDPMQDGLSHYSYVSGTPTRAVDSWGLKRTDISTDDVLQRCLDGIKNCLPEKYALAIGDVLGWYTDDNDPTADAYTDWMLRKGGPFGIPNQWKPSIVFNPAKGQSWDRRNKSPVGALGFCTTVLHELMHASHGRLGSYMDNFKERYINSECIQEQAEKLFNDNFKCMNKHLHKNRLR